ncbi:FHA domain-containing protein [Tessaracoccus aquimaris]|uniref:FHA domain-containing protein n=1 Tax=Tessaracoccus aquimaris TaxID=1332264 RepID=UPI0013144A53|nr:FHA domain-containing protein [Tessaracoccus aquimaris]
MIGRAPDAGKGPSGSYLLRVASPSSDISRNHLLVTTRDWNVHVTDLHSTNGTTVLPQGEAPFTLRDGASVQVELGTVLDLGDGVSLRIEPPRG